MNKLAPAVQKRKGVGAPGVSPVVPEGKRQKGGGGGGGGGLVLPPVPTTSQKVCLFLFKMRILLFIVLFV